MGQNEPHKFERRFPHELIDALKGERLFSEKLRPDIEKSDNPSRRVFPAVRRDRIDFYHQGGKLFTYDATGFRTNLKYAMGFEPGEVVAAEVTQDDLQHLRRIRTFLSGYESIKTLCALFGGLEAKKVADLFGQFSFAVRSAVPSPVVVLDIEASFDARVREDAENSQDRIDLVLFRISDGAILCVEAKLFENSAIRAAAGKVPEVVAQVERYRKQVQNQTTDILIAYRAYVSAMNELFGLTLPPPTKVIDVVPLLIIGFDSDQRKGRLAANAAALRQRCVCCLRPMGESRRAEVGTLPSWFRQAEKHSRASAIAAVSVPVLC